MTPVTDLEAVHVLKSGYMDSKKGHGWIAAGYIVFDSYTIILSTYKNHVDGHLCLLFIIVERHTAAFKLEGLSSLG